MGSGRFDAKDWATYASASSIRSKSTREIFTARKIDPDLNPRGVAIRESRDSVDNPQSTPVIIAQDVTGSMGMISTVMAKEGVPALLTEIYDRKPIHDPHVMCMAIGDVESDSAPLQVTQFEADMRIQSQLEKFFLEGGGGGNSYESYAMAWYFAAYHTVTDSFEKRGKKGYLFTIGDEEPTGQLTKSAIKEFLGTAPQTDVNMEDLLNEVSKKWEVFHIIVQEGSYARGNPDRVRNAWTELLGQRAIPLSDHTKLAEVIVSTMEVVEGKDVDDVAASWDGSTSLVVANAVKDLAKLSKTSTDIVTL